MKAAMHAVLLRSSSQNYRLCLLPVRLEYWNLPRLRLPLKAFFVSNCRRLTSLIDGRPSYHYVWSVQPIGDRCLNASNSAWRCAGVSRWSWAKLTLSGNAQPPACTVCQISVMICPCGYSSAHSLPLISIDGGQWSAGSILTSLIRNSVERALGMDLNITTKL